MKLDSYLMLVLLMSLFTYSAAACNPEVATPNGSSSASSGGTGGEVQVRGESLSVRSFYLSRSVVAPPDVQASLKVSYDMEALMLDLDPTLEEKRAAFVPDWSVHVYEKIWAKYAGFTFAPSPGPLSYNEATSASVTFDAASSDTLSTYPPQPWDDEWEAFAAGFIAAESSVEHPSSWDGTRVPMLTGALKCAKIGAINAGAKNIDEALKSIAAPGSLLYPEEEKAFVDLVTMK